ncbi:TM0106 family RecB-like putative nuclease [Ruicaihuangia caeni]|uniref:TM0106 family RecB-like putative nuclease n=1 Tax=Ruicaihuangia caeni TaxID=3042517 RepID=UPI00338DBE8D
MFILDGRIITSPSDLTLASNCEFAFLRGIDAKLGRVATVADDDDAMLVRAGALGDQHELNVLAEYRDRFGAGVVEIERPETLTTESIEAAAAATRDAFAAGADVVFQATFFDGSLVGFADFIVRRADGSYLVQDTKLARRAKVTALLQLAAYVDQLERSGVACAPVVQLLLGDGTVSEHQVHDIMPVYRKRRARLQHLVADRSAASAAVPWGESWYSVDGRCAVCAAEVEAHRDVLLVAGMRVQQRERLAAAGIRTIDELAAATERPDGLAGATFDLLRAQARLQLQAAEGAPPPVEIADAGCLGVIPLPDPGDVFFDFEGDPLYTEGDGRTWGLDYLWGLIEADGTFRAWWAHDFAGERAAMQSFMQYIGERRAQYPGMHIYHYASYERTHLLSIAARHGVCENEVDDLLRNHVLVDLYPVVRRAVRVGSRSYSIKKLEPLYMTGSREGQEVTTGADSIEEYVAARQHIEAGDTVEGERMLQALAEYNEYDCRSTLALRDWLLALGSQHGVEAGSEHTDAEALEVEPSPLSARLMRHAGVPLHERTADQTAAALASAAIDYHHREQKSFWWGHFSRLVAPIDEWAETRDVLRVERSWIERDWYREDGQRVERRELKLQGVWAPGSTVKASQQSGPYMVYEWPGPFTTAAQAPGARPYRSVRVLEVFDDGVLVEETLARDVAPYDDLPVALTPGAPPRAGAQQSAIESWADEVVRALDGGGWPENAMCDILRRRPPRTRSGRLAPIVGGDVTTAVVESSLDLDDSYLAVQGPPGTGKTWLASRVIARLVAEHGWRIGVVAQSHSVVENLLEKVASDTGLDPRLVAKAPKDRSESAARSYRVLADKNEAAQFAIEHAATGFVLGGTAWDFANESRVERGSLDLLVVDEAGQFSLGSTIAASVAARNVLLLGDPQQLPQVSQGAHPEPIDQSALGWIADGHDVLPAELGYFLAESRRMHPAVAEAVSQLSYEGALRSHPTAARRRLEHVEPGVHAVAVSHHGNSTVSLEEARRVVSLATEVLGRKWHEGSGGHDALARPLRPADIIVVAPYNAQVAAIREHLDAEGLEGVRAGTVDKFQGQEAVIAIVSLAASSAADVPRGMEFLIMRNRLNVAVSRAQWAAFLVHSPELTEFLPRSPGGVAELSAFIRLTER